MMILDTEQTKQEIASLIQERDIFKRQFLKIQENYENKIKELSILKELGNSLRSTNFNDRESFLWNQLKIIKTYTTLQETTLMLFNEDLQILEMVADSTADGPLREPVFAGLEEGPHGRALVDKSPVIVEGNDTAPIGGVGSMLCVPVMHNNSGIGVLSLRHAERAGFNPNHVRFYSLVADQIATAVILFRIYDQMLQEEKNRLLLSRFFSNRITEKIFGSGGNLRLGGERKNVTIMFADLSGFTSMSEHLDQQKVVEILNAYFSLMTPILFKYDGTLDKLMGDGIMAFFGAPISHEDDPVRAVQTAIEMMRALEDFNVQAQGRDWPTLQASIGINTGEVVAGYVGSEEHLNYTVIGDAVNVAQRLQSIAKPNEILISRTVQKEIEERMSELEGLKSLACLPAQKVKGKEKAVEVFRVEI